MNADKKLQRWLGIGAILFVVVYLGAAVFTVQSRLERDTETTMIESGRASDQERHLVLPELLLPMAILLALAGSYLIVRRRNQKIYDRLDDDLEDETFEQ